MAPEKRKEATLGEGRTYGNEVDAPPSYESSQPGPSTAAELSASPLATGEKSGHTAGPTVEWPFNFPRGAPRPAYSPPATSSTGGRPSASSPPGRPLLLPIAIPQIRADAAAPFLAAYHPSLLSHGIPASSWRSFLATLSAFLGARVPDRAASHAADVARRLGSVPRSFGSETLAHAREVARGIARDARRGNLVGAGLGAIGGAVTLPVAAALRAVGAAAALPFAVARRPRAPRERARDYVAVAGRDWLRPRGLRARLLDTRGLAAEVLGGDVAAEALLDAVASGGGAAEQLRALGGYIASLEIEDPAAKLDLGAKTLWLVVVPVGGEEEEEEGDGDEEEGEEEGGKKNRKGKAKA